MGLCQGCVGLVFLRFQAGWASGAGFLMPKCARWEAPDPTLQLATTIKNLESETLIRLYAKGAAPRGGETPAPSHGLSDSLGRLEEEALGEPKTLTPSEPCRLKECVV